MRIVAIDFETANAKSESACSLGITTYEDGVILDNYEWYFKPAHRYNYFTNSHIHHIYKKDVEDKPEFPYYYDNLKEILSDDAVIIAHNALFDVGVLNAVCDVYDLPHFKNRYLDTVTISRKVFPELYNHKLNTIAQYLCVDLKHHNACSDSYACMMIVLKSMEIYNTYDLDELISKMEMTYKVNK